MSVKILLIEDEEKIARFTELELVHEGYEVEKAADGRTGLSMAENGAYDLILLDIMLPELSGMEVLRRLRKTSQVPVIMLTARDAVMDKVSGLDMGADDYITKPFAIEELLARIRVALKKAVKTDAPARSDQENRLVYGQLSMDTARHTVTYGDTAIDLTKREFLLLRTLLENKSIVMSRDTLLERVWGYDYMGETNVVDVYVYYLRSKIDDVFGEKIIHTVRGIGYVIKDK
ncbi:response regulator transcription factor [Ihubacter massiliensis]|uniref:Stage 0 sporulation protein A homolog n=1 Tax=Hominibacterium faecale TaxID=2839743 RepID=A0A9J6QW94_9FIRM|nr:MULTISPECIES: response regulator transcription factor [Eubacteriales Family XIII. Incertae Sedis]MCO7121752.1 response regulator transcription factor [Ihubacter massiliensis]MCU7379158.1 response regulator transcription factor [Hominibacterium faecale]